MIALIKNSISNLFSRITFLGVRFSPKVRLKSIITDEKEICDAFEDAAEPISNSMPRLCARVDSVSSSRELSIESCKSKLA